MKNLRYIKTAIALVAIMSTAMAQNFSIGVSANHLYDLYEGVLEQGNGHTDLDMRGGHQAANFDLSYGLYMNYDFNDRVGLDINAEYGSMSGGFEVQYYNATIMLISAGVNLNIARDEDSKAWPYFRFSVGMGNYSSERKFMNDELVFSSTSGNCLQNGLGFGYAFKIGNDFGLRLGTEFIVNYTDAWDGYDNDTGTDILLRSGLKFTYTFPSKNAKYQRAVTPVKS